MVQQAMHTPGTFFLEHQVRIDPRITWIMDNQLFYSAAQQQTAFAIRSLGIL
jgi:hypothetical protein